MRVIDLIDVYETNCDVSIVIYDNEYGDDNEIFFGRLNEIPYQTLRRQVKSWWVSPFMEDTFAVVVGK